MRFPDRFGVRFFPPTVAILAKEPKSLSIEQEETAACNVNTGGRVVTIVQICGDKVLKEPRLTWRSVWRFLRNLEA
jgi:hypothetical protein